MEGVNVFQERLLQPSREVDVLKAGLRLGSGGNEGDLMVFGKLVVEELDIDSWGALQRDYRISNGMELTQEDSVIVQRFMHDLGGKCTKPRWAEKLLKWAAWEACGLEVEAGTKTTKKKTFGELKSEFYGQADKAPIPGFEGQPLSRHGCLHHGVTPDYTVLLDKTEELICGGMECKLCGVILKMNKTFSLNCLRLHFDTKLHHHLRAAYESGFHDALELPVDNYEQLRAELGEGPPNPGEVAAAWTARQAAAKPSNTNGRARKRMRAEGTPGASTAEGTPPGGNESTTN